METSIATVSLSGDLTGKVAAIARAGFDDVEVLYQPSEMLTPFRRVTPHER